MFFSTVSLLIAVGVAWLWLRSASIADRIDVKARDWRLAIHTGNGEVFAAIITKDDARIYLRWTVDDAPWFNGPNQDLFTNYRWGFGWAHGGVQRTGGMFAAVIVPYWFILCLIAMCQLILIRLSWCGRSRRASGFDCVECGYDHRATPNRCPECGWSPAAAKAIQLPAA